jgi:hypothetical protein
MNKLPSKTLIALLISGLLSIHTARSQSVSDLITQLILDAEKLTELKGILTDMYTGYKIVDKGYTAIKDIAQGNFNLHKAFLDGLLVVSPVVKNDTRVSDIINTEYNILTGYKTAMQRFQTNGHFTVAELNYISNVYAALFRRSGQDIDELLMVTTDDQLRMSDAQRLQTIDKVYGDIQGEQDLLHQWDNATSIQAMQRWQEANDIITLQSLYGIPQ